MARPVKSLEERIETNGLLFEQNKRVRAESLKRGVSANQYLRDIVRLHFMQLDIAREMEAERQKGITALPTEIIQQLDKEHEEALEKANQPVEKQPENSTKKEEQYNV
jgi:hypothetical protein